ncbi:MAG: amidase [Rhodospirillales bacterium]
MNPTDPLGALVPGPQPDIAGAEVGSLAGLTFLAKDIYDVAGFVTGFGNPDWAADHAPAERHATAVQALLDQGARLIGKTITDEFAYSVNGANGHYGTPANINAPGRLPGGSSSGSAAAVAGGLADSALGSDTGGSVRVPAAFCGLYGLRSSHGAIAKEGMLPMAPSFDVVGWFARDAGTLGRIGTALLPRAPAGPAFTRLLVAEDAMALALPEARAALEAPLARLCQLIAHHSVTLAPEGLEAWRQAFRQIQGVEFAACHRAWLDAKDPKLAPDLAERIGWALAQSDSSAAEARALRPAVSARLADLLGDDGLICLPTAPGIAPEIAAAGGGLEAWRQRLMCLTAPAGLAGLPQISLPLATLEGCPLGISLIAPPGRDRALLSFAARLEQLYES